MIEKNKLPKIYKESIFYKLKKTILSIFNRKSNKKIQNDDKTKFEIKEKSFLENIKIEQDLETEKLLLIQQKLEGNLNEENLYKIINELSSEERNDLKNLYKEQINELEIELQNYKKRIISVKKKLSENS